MMMWQQALYTELAMELGWIAIGIAVAFGFVLSVLAVVDQIRR